MQLKRGTVSRREACLDCGGPIDPGDLCRFTYDAKGRREYHHLVCRPNPTNPGGHHNDHQHTG